VQAVEAATVTAGQARELTDRIKVAVDGTWLLIQEAYTSRAWAALGYRTWDDYCTREFGTSRLRLPREERQEVVASLREIGMSVRAIAAATGEPRSTVSDVVSGVRSRTPELRTQEWDAAFRENDTDPDQLDDEEYAVLTQPTSGDHGIVPEPPRPVTGTDGKHYPAQQPARTPVRQALPPQFKTVGAELTRVTARIERLQVDDRFQGLRGAIAAQCLPEVRRAAEVLRGLLSDLGHEDGDPR
jgi:hypothetical protein